MLPHTNQILNAFLVLGTTTILILLVSLLLLKRKSKHFYFNQSTLSNHLKKAPINAEIYFFLKQLATEGRVNNSILLEYFRQNNLKTLDSVIKKKNKMITLLFELQDSVFSIPLIKKIKDPNDHRQVIYVLNKWYTLKEIK
jgi:LPXTG-motif cell wall-anchored protein